MEMYISEDLIAPLITVVAGFAVILLARIGQGGAVVNGVYELLSILGAVIIGIGLGLRLAS